MALKEAKTKLRIFMKNLLETVSAEETQRQSEAVCSRVTESEWFRESKRLSVYVSTSGEIQTDFVIRTALAMGKEVYIPQFTKGSKEMEMVRVPDQAAFDSLPVTLWGIRQPSADWNWDRYQNTGPLDVILVPGVAFSSSGLRCGHGKGYYDRFFSGHLDQFTEKLPLKIGLALREQMVREVPVDETDVLMDHVIYEGDLISDSQH